MTYLDGYFDALSRKGIEKFSKSKEYDRGYMKGVDFLIEKEKIEKIKLDQIMSKTENNKWGIK
jgi:hypothetical protein